jgi:hypothetical protein
MTYRDYARQGGEEYELRIVAQADDHAPPIVRLRHVLKALLRQYGFRCVSVRETTPHLPAACATAGSSPPSGGSTAGGVRPVEAILARRQGRAMGKYRITEHRRAEPPGGPKLNATGQAARAGDVRVRNELAGTP